MLTDLAVMLLRPGASFPGSRIQELAPILCMFGKEGLVVSVLLVEECGLFVESGFLVDPRCGKGFPTVNCLVPVKSLRM